MYVEPPKSVLLAYGKDLRGQEEVADTQFMDVLEDDYEELMSPQDYLTFMSDLSQVKFCEYAQMVKDYKGTTCYLTEEEAASIWSKHEDIGAKRSTVLAKAQVEKINTIAAKAAARRLALIAGLSVTNPDDETPEEWSSRIEVSSSL